MYHLVKEKGLTLEGARQVLRTRKDEETKRVEAIERLEDLKAELMQLEEEFDRLHTEQKYANRSAKE